MQGDDATADDGGQTADAPTKDVTAPDAAAVADAADAAPDAAVSEVTATGSEEEGPDPLTDGRPAFATVAEAFTKADEDGVAFKPEEVVSE
jgi:hypothetical protein